MDEAIEFVGLGDYTRFRPGKLSGGLARRLNIACGIAHKPELVFFDEPTVAVDPQSRNAILDGICRLRDEGATVVYTSHYMEEVEQICSRIMIMDGGKTLAEGTNDELKRMISMGEKVVIEVAELPAEVLARVRALPHVLSADVLAGSLTCSCEAGPQSPRVRSLQTLAACLVLTLFVCLVSCAVGLVALREAVTSLPAWQVALAFGSNFAFALVPLAIAFLLASVGAREEVLNACGNILGMVMSFMGGAWVPLSFMGPPSWPRRTSSPRTGRTPR